MVAEPEVLASAEKPAILSLNAYGAEVRFECDDPEFTRWLHFLVPAARFEPLAWTNAPVRSTVFQISVDRVNKKREREHRVTRNGELVFENHSLSRMQWFLERCLLREAALGLETPYSLVHAAAAEKDGVGILLPASSKSGKSTLVAALALSGFTYYSDEVGIMTESQKLLPYPKAITLKPGGWDTILRTFPSSRERMYKRPNGNTFRHLMAPIFQPPTDLSSAVDIKLVILPKYKEGRSAKVKPIEKAQAMRQFARRSMNWKRLGPEGFMILSNVLQAAECYRLYTNDLHESVALVKDLVAQHKPQTSAAAG